MQVTETNRDGLLRQYKVVVAAADIAGRVNGRLQELSQQVKLPGFRPGKVPLDLVKKRYGQSVMGEVLERALQDSSSEALTKNGVRPAMQPKIEITSFGENVDLEYTLAVETLPDITPIDFKTLSLERLVAEATAEDVEKALQRLAESSRPVEALKEPRPARSGDVVVIDFVGRIDGQEFAGGKASDYRLSLGSGSFLPGFEDQLVGTAAGATVTVNVSFPEGYGNEKLSGKPAAFEVTVKEILERKEQAIDDAFAKGLGFESVDQLKERIKADIGREYAAVSRSRLKRVLLDALSSKHDFAVPKGMVDAEFEGIWKQLMDELKRSGEKPEKDEEAMKAEYRQIADRRVRLGLLLAEVGRKSNLQVTPEDLNRAVMEEARRFPGRERQVIEYYSRSQEALASLRAPIYEDKVVDYIVEMAKVSERKVTAKELAADPDAPVAA